jgi:hypothetical protein
LLNQNLSLTLSRFLKFNVMSSDLITQAEYARFIGRSRARVCQMVKGKKLNTVWMNGNVVIRLTTDEQAEYIKFLAAPKIQA